jgi:AmiR/NasT family two-component response regulator
MISALIVCTDSAGAPELAADLQTIGLPVVGTADSGNLVQMAIQTAPDVVVCHEQYPTDALFSSISILASTAPRPVILFTIDPDAEKIERATKAGVHAYVVNGYGLHRLRSVIHVAQARFRRDELLRGELSDVNQRFEERKLVDRAKGILMRSHQISEDQAFRALRTAAMHSKQRMGQVAQQIIEAARYAEAVNRAGQLRMFSQRIVKHYALICAGVRSSQSKNLLDDSVDSVSSTLSILGRTLSKPTFGDLLDAVTTPWLELRAMLKASPVSARLREVDRLAEEFLTQSEQLVVNLEIAGMSQSLHVINVAGRQRMLSQRAAKEALLVALFSQTEAAEARASLQVSRAAFVDAMSYLNTIPLTTRDITEKLRAAHRVWEAFETALLRAGTQKGQQEIAELSETLLGLFDQLTEQYELGMQMLMR